MAILKRAKVSIQGLPEDLQTINSNIGVLADLTTEEKSSLVGAINEVLDRGADVEGVLKADQNLGDVNDVAEARTNLQVLSAAEVEAAIEAAQLNVGSNHVVADIAARDALTGLGEADRVLVKDDGDGKWAMYTPSAVVEGVASGWTKLMDQDSLENAISAAAIKEAYESNDDTNAFTDAEKAKLTVAIVEDAIAAELDDESTNAQVAGAAAVVAYVKDVVAGISAGAGLVATLETLPVVQGAITLTNAPAGGVNGVMNFGTVRYIDDEGVAYDAPVVATADDRVFNISTDTAGQWDGNSVQVQYVHVPV